MLNSDTATLGSVTDTRIAGPSYDQHHAEQVERVAAVHNYVTRIRALAARAARDAIARMRSTASQVPVSGRRTRAEIATHGRPAVAGTHRIIPE